MNDEMTNKDYDYLMGLLCPWGSLDVWHMVKRAEECDLSMCDVCDILQDTAEELGINLYDHSTDVNALLNMHILEQVRQDIENSTDIDIVNDYDVYFFANYLDCPLQYSTECKEALENVIKERQLTEDNFNACALYVLSEMGIDVKTRAEE